MLKQMAKKGTNISTLFYFDPSFFGGGIWQIEENAHKLECTQSLSHQSQKH